MVAPASGAVDAQAEAAEEDDHEEIAERRNRSGTGVDRPGPGEDL